MLVTGNDILIPARAGQYGVGSFNTNNMEITQAIIHTAERLRSPVMVQMSEGAIKYGGQDLANIVIDLARRATVPVALHLDHGSSYESALKAILARCADQPGCAKAFGDPYRRLYALRDQVRQQQATLATPQQQQQQTQS